MSRKEFFNIYFNEEGEEGEEMATEEQATAPPPPAMLDDESDENSITDKKFPMEQDGTTPEQDLLNFTNYQKLQYFKKFNSLLSLVQKTTLVFNNSKNYVNFDEIDDEKQHKIINLLISSLEETTDQINFFLEKGIASVNIDKTRVIFKAIVNKLNIIIDTFEGLMKRVENEEKNN